MTYDDAEASVAGPTFVKIVLKKMSRAEILAFNTPPKIVGIIPDPDPLDLT
jgi:hypothetical protein